MLAKLKVMFSSWKTAVAGLVVGLSAAGVAMGLLDAGTAGWISTVATTLGLVAAQDASKPQA